MARCMKNKAENDKIDNTIEKKEDMKAAKKSSTKAELTVSAPAGTAKKGADAPAEAKKAPAKKAATKPEVKPQPASATEAKTDPKKAPAKKAATKTEEVKPQPEPIAEVKAETKKAPAKRAATKTEEVKPQPEPIAEVKAETKKAPAKKAATKTEEVKPQPEPIAEVKAETKKAPARKAAPKAAEVKIDESPKDFSVKAEEEKPKADAAKPDTKRSKAHKPEDAVPQASKETSAQGEPNISSPSNVETPAPAPEEIGSVDTAEGQLATYPEETPVEEQPAPGEIKDNPPQGQAVEVSVDVPAQQEQVRYSDEELAEFAEVITQQRFDALDELRMLKDRLDDLTSAEMAEESMIYSMHMAEQGSEAIEKEKTYAQIQRINEYIKKLDDALKRIKDKTYGVCRVCNILIAKERLMAVPITTLSASYKIHSRCPEDGIDRIEPIKVG
ncbi:MAG: hypothetical protein ACM3U1_01320 [Chloroflexota bacterium]